jgi:hypothetical protein
MGSQQRLRNMTDFETINRHFSENYGFDLFLKEEVCLMGGQKKPSRWVGANHPNVTLLRRNGKPTTLYPQSHGIIANGGRRPVSLSTLISNIKDKRPLYLKV